MSPQDVLPARRRPHLSHRPQGGRQDASQGSGSKTSLRARTSQATRRRAPRAGHVPQVRQTSSRARAKSLRDLPGERPGSPTRPLQEGQAGGDGIRRPLSREPPAHGAREEQEAKTRTTRGGPLCVVRTAGARRRKRGLRAMLRRTPGGREEALRRKARRGAMWTVRGGSHRQRFYVRFVRREGFEAPSAQERREPGSLSRQEGPQNLRGLFSRCTRSGEMRALRPPIVFLLGRTQGHTRPSDTLHRGRTRHGRGTRPPRLLGGGRHVPRLRETLPGRGRGHRRQLHDGDDHSLGVNAGGGGQTRTERVGLAPPRCAAGPHAYGRGLLHAMRPAFISSPRP